MEAPKLGWNPRYGLTRRAFMVYNDRIVGIYAALGSEFEFTHNTECAAGFLASQSL